MGDTLTDDIEFGFALGNLVLGRIRFNLEEEVPGTHFRRRGVLFAVALEVAAHLALLHFGRVPELVERQHNILDLEAFL